MSETGTIVKNVVEYIVSEIVEDKKSGEYRLSHHIDLKTGLYNGKKILDK